MIRAALIAAVVWFASVILWMVLLNLVWPIPSSDALLQVGWVAAALAPPLIGGLFVLRRFRKAERAKRVDDSSIVTSSGFRFVPGAGTDREPVICLETNPALLKTAEREYLHEWLYPLPDNPQLVRQQHRHIDGRVLDVQTVQLGLDTRDVYFDVSRSAAFH